jgi:Ni,Fe-hydrogenase III small subunit/formate hydrogenlyase subunit 6/NADH:ubiquinone oxidoreductase subunit I
MFEILRKIIRTGVVTTRYPDAPAELASEARGRPAIDFAAWRDARPAAEICPTGAISCQDRNETRLVNFDLGKCTFCGLCADVDSAIHMTSECELAVTRRRDLRCQAHYQLKEDGTHQRLTQSPVPCDRTEVQATANRLHSTIQKTLRRSLHIREVDAGSCNGCEVEIVGLNSPIYDLERFGIHFVASPRHADMLLVTGPVTRNMELALRKTYDATPEPRLVVAVGACGCSGGIFGQNYASCGGVDQVLPVDVYIPGCPPNPHALLQGILVAVGRLEQKLKRD